MIQSVDKNFLQEVYLEASIKVMQPRSHFTAQGKFQTNMKADEVMELWRWSSVNAALISAQLE